MCFFFSGVKFGVERIDSSFSFHQRFSFRIADVHELGADRAAVRVAQCLHDLAQRMLLVGPKYMFVALNMMSMSASVKS